MNLSIDIGNSKVKIAVFKADKICDVSSFANDELLSKLLEVKSKHFIKATILSTTYSIILLWFIGGVLAMFGAF